MAAGRARRGLSALAALAVALAVPVAAEEPPPDAELLLYLAEFGDDPDALDPAALDLLAEPTQTTQSDDQADDPDDRSDPPRRPRRR